MNTPTPRTCGELSCDECNARTAALTTERDAAIARAERAEADAAAYLKRAESFSKLSDEAEAELATAKERLRSEAMDDYAAIKDLQRELATERARMDYLSTRGFEHRHHETGDHLAFEWTISSTNELKDVSLREVIDAAMKEGAK